MAIRFWLKHPIKGLARVRYWVWEKLNPDKPWMCPGTIKFCEQHLTRDMKAIEFGSGRSTAWFSSKVGQIISVEHHAEWYNEVRKKLTEAAVKNVDYRLVVLDHPHDAPEQDHYDKTPAYVAVVDAIPDHSIHFAVVDGHYRTTCVKHLLKKIAPGGYLLVDDVNMWPALDAIPVPKTWPIVDNSTNGVKNCVIWQAPKS